MAEQPLFESRRVTDKHEYTRHIEGPAVDAAGNLYVVNLHEDGNIGKVPPGATQSQLFTTLPDGGIGSGIRFDRGGRMFIADFNNHKIHVIEPGESEPQPYFASSDFHQPNDLAMAADGTLYASDPKASAGIGQIWRVTRRADGAGHGEVMSSTRPHMGITNGIDLSPDQATLYVSESRTCEVWAYRPEGTKLLDARRLIKFPDFDVDGLRTDIDGRIFLARPDAGKVAVIAPDGTLVKEIALRGKGPTNLTFGGPDGKTVFVTQTDGGFIEAFRTDRPGREPRMQLTG